MDVLLCAACGRRPTEPVGRFDEMPEYPGQDGLPGPGGRRHGPARVCCGAYEARPAPDALRVTAAEATGAAEAGE
ncbi:hypothetical protein AAW14_19510 [Streptomyces hygroscopicus]|uniref:hypothetical protein n=1 Tax=Streptomyces hygroscopicus TaxID=1912 RepID=UPI00223EDC6B|nr:hypothetical protein [Streptomyces hygroscopicus]MCW7944174.1 hypothetical protein [Streptomyces hygroscopicus]